MYVVGLLALIFLSTAMAAFGVWAFVFSLYTGFPGASAGQKTARRQALVATASLGVLTLLPGLVLAGIAWFPIPMPATKPAPKVRPLAFDAAQLSGL